MITSMIMLTASLSLDAHLPPLTPWQGQSEQLMQMKGPLTTDFELSKGMNSPDYQQTMAFVERLVAANPTQFKAINIGYSNSGRAVKMLIASEQSHFTASMIKNNNKPTLLIQAGIHAGEIDGKDAAFMMLRDIALGKRRDLLSKVNILFIPILNVDGHERRSKYNRINQRGPVEMGFRTNANNLNLNRDYTKLDTPEVQAILKVIDEYQPDLYLDVHVTDGADYQYDITYGFNPEFASESPAIARVLETQIKPVIDKALEQQGHIPGPLVFAMDKRDFKKGIAGWVATPRFSNGWGDLAGVPTILVENHSLKPYKQRVLGTYVLYDGLISALSKYQTQLDEAVTAEQNNRPEQLIVKRAYAKQPDTIPFKGITYKLFQSAISGQTEAKYLGEKIQYDALPIYWQKDVVTQVEVPDAFYIPPAYPEIVEKLQLHGIKVTKIEQSPESIDTLISANVTNYEFAKAPFEGRFMVEASFSFDKVKAPELSGWYKVSTEQKRGKLATHLLHPQAPDSFFSWGEFNTIFQRTEYVENYALEPFARSMLKENPTIALEFDRKIREDKAFADDPNARMEWLYAKTPFYDQAYLKYPILMLFKEK
ncbi:M14 family metallopeptidase [Pseudoalteromonas byunsanensis]|uniref:Peptidase M14 n=1 Tax=Pseudoalteromonas byunsanensis TaxID=327939 RepID=A0A1S1NAR8_9GAMM|nr:M14 family metallopeptidase [Pseudoalteromonas byunsanensis]OHU96758.1 peptidase M14 [Pseudoalteromonas byunsanensis]